MVATFPTLMNTDSYIQGIKRTLRQGIGLEHAQFRLVNPNGMTMVWDTPKLKALHPGVDHHGMRKVRVFGSIEELMNDRRRRGLSSIGHYSVYSVPARGLVESTTDPYARWRLMDAQEDVVKLFHVADVYVMNNAVGRALGEEVLELDLEVSGRSVQLQRAGRVMDPGKWSAVLHRGKVPVNGQHGGTVISVRPDEEIARGQARRSYSALTTAFENRPPSLDWASE